MSRIMQGKVHLEYQWNPGSTIGEFLTALREGQLKAGICDRTGAPFLPAQSRSPSGGKCKELREVAGTARLRQGTVVHRAPWNVPEGLEPPYMLAAIGYEGVETELIHLVAGSLETLQSLQPGQGLEPVWKDQRTGSIRDILYFQPL